MDQERSLDGEDGAGHTEKPLSTKHKRVTAFKNGTRSNAHVLHVSDNNLDGLLQRVSSLLLFHTGNNADFFQRVFNSDGGEITDIDTILHGDVLFFSRGEDFIWPDIQANIQSLYMLRGGSTGPPTRVVRSVLQHLLSLLDDSLNDNKNPTTANKLQFMADYETFAQDVRPILDRSRELTSEEMMLLLWEVFINHGTPAMEEQQERLVSGMTPQTTGPPPPPHPVQPRNNEVSQPISASVSTAAKAKQKRALTGFNLFYRDKCKEFRESQHDPGMGSAEVAGRIAPRIAKAWKQLTEEERRSYHEQARARQQQQLLSGLRNTAKSPTASPIVQAEVSSQFQTQQAGYSTNFRFYNYSTQQQPTHSSHIPSIASLTGQPPTQHFGINTPQSPYYENRGKRSFSETHVTSIAQLPPIISEDIGDQMYHQTHQQQNYQYQPRSSSHLQPIPPMPGFSGHDPYVPGRPHPTMTAPINHPHYPQRQQQPQQQHRTSPFEEGDPPIKKHRFN
jgi:hypothetical protein